MRARWVSGHGGLARSSSNERRRQGGVCGLCAARHSSTHQHLLVGAGYEGLQVVGVDDADGGEGLGHLHGACVLRCINKGKGGRVGNAWRGKRRSPEEGSGPGVGRCKRIGRKSSTTLIRRDVTA